METDTMSSMHFLDQGQLLPSRKRRLYDLFEMAVPQEAEDPIHRTVDQWHGIDVAERFLGFSLKEISSSCSGIAATLLSGIFSSLVSTTAPGAWTIRASGLVHTRPCYLPR
jgi:hypothetical protein